MAAEFATVDHLSGGRLNVAVGSGWMPEEFDAVSATDLFPRRHAHVRETLDILHGIWTNEVFEYHGEFADFGPSGFGAKPVQQPHPPVFFSGLKDPKRAARRVAKYNLAGWIGIQDSPTELQQWRGAIADELDAMDTGRTIDDLEVSSMLWFVIMPEAVDQSDLGKGSNLLVGSAEQITEKLIEYKNAGLTMPLLWPPFADVPVAKTLDDMRQLSEQIMPEVERA